jgi:hypothetical protein
MGNWNPKINYLGQGHKVQNHGHMLEIGYLHIYYWHFNSDCLQTWELYWSDQGDLIVWSMMSQVKVEGSKVNVEYSKLSIYTSSCGSFNCIFFKPVSYIVAPEGISQCEEWWSRSRSRGPRSRSNTKNWLFMPLALVILIWWSSNLAGIL